ncbi:GGDEF domain-containing protein [Treponema brennaborense]|uniref:diguanylate cyclase n=1 Tax=Treponema brennaborense (strain DSM 12168 / CIP 105900 / DD5/3) TaxID=906968 RepID=F4LIG7_TREBD|nr:GGDEF domain-containing protein [Treponema brennaborense]AEE16208.1 diguanylate cyclase [Treponema brennaborense DSM 12168]
MNEDDSLMDRVLDFISETAVYESAAAACRIGYAVPGGNSGSLMSFSHLLEKFVHLDFTEDEAIRHWERILLVAQQLERKLGQHVSAYLAIVDYFTSAEHVFDSPVLIEVHVLRKTEELAMLDGLTGAFNRRYMDVALKKELNRSTRYGKQFSLIILDIDDFKRLNDTYGHEVGDIVLQEFSDAARSAIREEDVFCRYGGEEFLVILPETDTSGAYVLAERIRHQLESAAIHETYGITFSAGTVTYPDYADNSADLLRRVDRALYQAKFNGKNQTVSAVADTL